MKLKDNIYIEFSDKQDFKISKNKETMFICKTTEFPELFENIDFDEFWDKNKCDCQERTTCYYCENFFNKEGILKLSDKEFCHVYKKYSNFEWPDF